MHFLLSILFILLSPMFCLAQVDGFSIIDMLIAIVNGAIPIAVGVSLLVFIWGVIGFISSVSDSERIESKKKIAWGLIALFVIVSIWGVVFLLSDIFGVNLAETQEPPLVQW